MSGRKRRVPVAVAPPPPDPALVAVTERIAQVISDADARLERILQRLRAQVRSEESQDAR